MSSNFDTFMKVYTSKLLEAVTAHPQEYAFGPDKVPEVANRIGNAIMVGSYNHDGRAFKATCKELGIKYTRTGIEQYLGLARGR